MTLPRFTSGQFGRLDFSHLNDAFGYIDLQRGSGEKDPLAADERLPLITARITGRDSANHSWVEVARQSGSWQDVQGGRTSTSASNDFAFPAMTVDESHVASDSIVVLVPKRGMRGEIRYVILNPVFGMVQLAMIQTVEAIDPGRRWRYIAQTATASASGAPLVPSYSTSGTPFVLFNSVEEMPDTATIYGVGSYKNANFTIVRQPLRVGLIVLATRISSSMAVCSIPNGYRYECV